MIAGLKPYPQMRDSGVPWLGDVPDHWRVERGVALVQPRFAKNVGLTEKQVLSLSYGRIIVKPEEKLRGLVPESFETYQHVFPDDIIVRATDLQNDKTSLRVAIARDRGIITSAYLRLVARDGINPEYAYRLLHGYDLMKVLYGYGSGLRQNLEEADFKQMPVPIPSPDEQAAIVRFLDHADRRIRRSIVAKQKMIRLLEEQKAAIIHQAVKRGLNPDAPMKPSGVDWLGDIPAHWEMVPLKRRISFQEGPGIMAADFRESGIPLLRISSLAGEIATLDGCNYLDAAMVEKKWSHFAVRPGDYLLTSSGSLGSVCVADQTVEGAIPYTGIIRLWPKAGGQADMRYARWFFGSAVFETQMKFLKAGVGIEHFGPTHLNRMMLLLPPPDEQKQIAHHLETEAALVGDVISTARREIDLLNEYRARLVADVVSGKLDIRAAAAALPQEPLDEPLEADDALEGEGEGEGEDDFDAEEALEEA